ncbi:uncharacterized protein LOC143807966 [Ranitomeya variabilis]|uniref:uncharacterized protein LOC143807966 n=1 Tax=Ranitomeya variabilis TaxID=490064 RepID=UPI0040570FAF
MHRSVAPIFPILDKSYLFVHLPTDPQNPNGIYLQCPATGNLYCTSTGTLYRKMIEFIPLSANTSSLNQEKDSSLQSGYPTPRTVQKFTVNTKNTDKQENGDLNLTIESCTAQHIQSNNSSIISNVPCNKNLNVKKADQPIQGSSASIKPNTKKKKASKNKTDTSAQANSLSQPANNLSTNLQGSSHPDKKKKEKKCTRKAKDKSVPLEKNSCPISKTKSVSSKLKKSTVLIKPKLSLITNNPSPSFKNTALTTHTSKKSEEIIHPNNNLSTKSNGKSFTYYKFHLLHLIKFIQPIQINFEHLLFPQDVSLALDKTKFSSKHAENNTEIIQVLSDPKKKYFPQLKKKEKLPSLSFSKAVYTVISLEKNLKKKTAKKKTFGQVSLGSKNSWAFLRPFQRRPHPYHCRKKSKLSSECKNYIMASSVHEIIHSRYAKNPNERMPVSQLRAMLSSGDWKLRKRSEWIQQMEEDAIHKYKKMNLEKHNQRLEVKEHDVLHHNKKVWLACTNRTAVNRKDNKSWPLLVKCLHKHPDSTLRQACKHRSFCLRWDGTSYALRLDHAYYTQIQCHMAVTDTSYAELVVHTRKETTILPVNFDFEFWKQTEATLETFYTNNILPYLKKNKIESNPASVPLDPEKRNDVMEE